MSSCVSQRKIEYIRERDEDTKAFTVAGYPDYKLKSNDELYITINSLDEQAANVFSNIARQPLSLDPYGTSLLSYSIDKDGYLLLPIIGNIFVKDKTLSEVSLILRDSLTHVLNQPIVSVKLVNRYVSVLGEVLTPGHYPFSQEKLSIFDALGLAGDITVYGNRNDVILVRTENGISTRTGIDLTRSNVLASDFYYLRPNDILYVKPLRNKFWVTRQIPLTLLLSTITTGLLIYSIVHQ